MDLRERAKELAFGAAKQCHTTKRDTYQQIIERALLQFAREALVKDPDEAMLRAGTEIVAVITISDPNYPIGRECTAVWREMSAHRAAALAPSPSGRGGV